MSTAVMLLRMKMYRQAEHWPALEAVSKYITKRAPRKSEGWINYACALKELGRIGYSGEPTFLPDTTLPFSLVIGHR